jgi:RND superfamily putative drug exporter
VRSVLVPALVLMIGPRVWWPSSLARAEGLGGQATREEERLRVET